MIPLKDLIALTATLADGGDEDAAQRLNQMADTYPPSLLQEAAAWQRSFIPASDEVAVLEAPAPVPACTATQTLGDILGSALSGDTSGDDAWQVVEAAADLIAAHYRLSLDDVWPALFDINASWIETGGVDGFADLLDEPDGFNKLGLWVAERVMGAADAALVPPITLSIH